MERTLEHGASADGGLVFAAIAHPAAAAAPRRYFARRGERVVVFDGLPLPVHDAEELLDGWDELELEGVFSALRIDLAAATVDVRLDALGMAKLFRARRAGGEVLSNSVELIGRLLGLSEPDPARRLVDGRLRLGGRRPHAASGCHDRRGARHAGARRSRARGRRVEARPRSRTRSRLWRAVPAQFEPLTCGLTAGRDTRVVLALARAAALDVSYYTSGREDGRRCGRRARPRARARPSPRRRHADSSRRLACCDERRSARRRTDSPASGSSETGRRR